MLLETPVTVTCDSPGCVDVDMTLALAAVGDGGEAADPAHIEAARRRAAAAALDNAAAHGWLITVGGHWCPLHARGRVVLS